MFFFNMFWGWKAFFQLFYDIDKTSTRLTCNNIVKAFHIFLIALLQYNVFGVFVSKQGDGINGCLL
ncbi:hypothetical protein APT95_04140 [Providencia stuartii]|nr:hypothetical protein APT95_04140 [Providencia stuartii]